MRVRQAWVVGSVAVLVGCSGDGNVGGIAAPEAEFPGRNAVLVCRVRLIGHPRRRGGWIRSRLKVTVLTTGEGA